MTGFGAPPAAGSADRPGGRAHPPPVSPPPASPPLDKRGVAAAFDHAARRYDWLCALNPGYRSHLRRSARRLRLPPGARVLDLCCGTGLSTAALRAVHPQARLTGLDASLGMLAVARRKPGLAGVELVAGDAAAPRAAGIGGHFDAVFMAYGIRNLPDTDAGLAAVRDLLRPGGQVCFHEYSVADSRWARWVWQLVAGGIIVPLGRLATGSPELFAYLRRSVAQFDGVGAFCDRLRAAGFTEVRALPHGGWQRGIVHSFLARRPVEEAAPPASARPRRGAR